MRRKLDLGPFVVVCSTAVARLWQRLATIRARQPWTSGNNLGPGRPIVGPPSNVVTVFVHVDGDPVPIRALDRIRIHPSTHLAPPVSSWQMPDCLLSITVSVAQTSSFVKG